MRSISLLLLAICATGCTTMKTVQPAPPPVRDHKTPVALGKSSASQRMMEQRLRNAEVASGQMAVEGHVTR